MERKASHAGSWYSGRKEVLDSELDGWLSMVPDSFEGVVEGADKDRLPIPRARIIIAPHAGYSYSGPAAAWAYKALDLRDVKRVFILGPSHHKWLDDCALTRANLYETPLGNLHVDRVTTSVLRSTGKFSTMSIDTDTNEHSIEMHLPYAFKRLQQTFPDLDPESWPPIVPILVGGLKPDVEKEFGEVLAPYLRDPSNAFIVSSDFCHWGSRFSYTYYKGADGTVSNRCSRDDVRNGGVPIHESITQLDEEALDAIETGKHDVFVDYLKRTANTVCGRHPIGVIMAGLEKIRKEDTLTAGAQGASSNTGGGGGGGIGVGVNGRGMFKFVRYEQSSSVTDPRDSSVSYASAYAII